VRQLWARGHCFEAFGLALFQRSVPKLGEGENQRVAPGEQHRMFEGNKKPALTEEQKTLIQKREELARVQERLRDPDLRAGIAKELRKHVELLEVEIADLEAAS
jgi:hypothetical protein